MAGLSQSEFARRMGVSKQVVQRAVKRGRIEAGEDGLIDWASQSKAFKDNADPSRERGEQSQSAGAPSSAYGQVRTASTLWAARMKQLQYEKAAGLLISKAEVLTSLRKFSLYVRDSILLIPDRVAPVISAEIESSLTKILKKHLEKKLADRILAEIGPDMIARLVRDSWEKESSHVMRELENGKIIKE